MKGELMKVQGREFQIHLAHGMSIVAVLIAVLSYLALTEAASANGAKWYQVQLEQGESQGYRWGVGAKVPKGQPLKDICSQAVVIEPPKPDVPYVDSNDLTDCGKLLKPADSVVSSATISSEGSPSTFFVALYRPVVRKVSFLLSTGERKVFWPGVPQVPNRVAMGVPLFRYIVAWFQGACVRSTKTFDVSGKVIAQAGEPCAARPRRQ
jgi:hypothetical protein